jgi:uncharacterized protein involved in exopolysaccharide biosynthesis
MPASSDGFISLEALLARVWAGRWWVIACVVLAGAAFATAAFQMTPVYRSAVVLIPGGEERAGLSGALGSALGSLGGLASLAGVNVGSGGQGTEESLAVLRSRQFTEQFIDTEGLMPKLYPKKWDATAGKWRVPESERPTPARAYKYFDQRIRSVSLDRKTGLVTLQIDWRDPAEAANWANELVDRLNAEMRARAIAKSEASLGFLQKELAATAVVDTRAAINRLIESQVNQRMLANVTMQYAFRVVDPALPADRDDPVRPKKLLMTAAGVFVGLVFGMLLTIFVRRPPE